MPPGDDKLEITPASIARHVSYNMLDLDFDTRNDELRMLANLEEVAYGLCMDGQWFVNSNRGVSVPKSHESSGSISYYNFMDLTFEGDFITYSKVIIGKIIGATSVRAVCITFDNVTLLPYFDKLPDDHYLHVPVLAINEMQMF